MWTSVAYIYSDLDMIYMVTENRPNQKGGIEPII